MALYDNSKYTLEGYSAHQRQNWEHSRRIKIYESEAMLREFINIARNDNLFNDKMYFGKIPQALAERIKKDIGVDVYGYNVTISAYEIRKIFKDHGCGATENLRGQRAIVEDDIVQIPQIIQKPDKISLAHGFYNGKPVIKFEKTINGRTTIISYVSDKHHDLMVQSIYSGKKSETLAMVTAEQATVKTPEAADGTGFTSS